MEGAWELSIFCPNELLRILRLELTSLCQEGEQALGEGPNLGMRDVGNLPGRVFLRDEAHLTWLQHKQTM